MGEHRDKVILDITTWELFLCGAMMLIGKRVSNGVGVEIRPVFQVVRQPHPKGMITQIFPVGFFPIDALPLPSGAVSYPISKLGGEERRHMAHSVAQAEEMLKQMQAAGVGITLAHELPK